MKSFKKQFVLGGIAALALAALTVGCNKTADGGYEVDTNAVQNVKETTTNAAINAWDATKEGAKTVGSAMTNAAEHVRDGTTNAWEKITSTNQ